MARRLEGLDVQDMAQLGQLIESSPELLTGDPGYPLGPELTASTNEAGVATFRSLPAGVYQVHEVSTHVGNEYHQQASPFLVYIAEGQNLLVDAKNQPVTVDKQALTPMAAPGGTAEFRITAFAVPADANGELHQFVVGDELDPRLEYRGVRNAALSYGTTSETLTEGTDFVVDVSGPTVTISLTPTALQRVAHARQDYPGTRVTFDLTAAVRPDADVTETVYNTALYAPDGHCVADDPAAAPAVPPTATQTRVTLAECVGAIKAVASTRASMRLTHTAGPPPAGQKATLPWWPALLGLLGLGGANRGGSSAAPGPVTQGTVTGTPQPDGPSQRPTGAAPGERPVDEGARQAPSRSGSATPGQRVRDVLASTGASVIGLIALGLGLVLIGLLLVRRRKDEEAAENE